MRLPCSLPEPPESRSGRKVIGVSTKQIRRWRDGTSEMGIEKLEKLCRYYHVSADYILGLPRDLDWPRG